MKTPVEKSVSTTDVTVAICGNPNCGKTTLFNALTGLHQKVGNYPGVTVERVSGQFQLSSTSNKSCTLVDIPGTYSLAAFSPDEFIAAKALFGDIEGEKKPDAAICVIDATNLERGLYFLFQVMKIKMPIVVALNMVDIAERRNLQIDHKKLSSLLGGIEVIPVIGSKGIGIKKLQNAISKAVINQNIPEIEFYSKPTLSAIEVLHKKNVKNSRSDAELIRVLFDQNGPAEKEYVKDEGSDSLSIINQQREKLQEIFGTLSSAETITLTSKAKELYDQVVTVKEIKNSTKSDIIDKVLLHPFIGPVLLIFLMSVIFQAIFSWAEPVMNLIDSLFGSISLQVENLMEPGPFRSLLIDGVIGGVGSVLIFLPQIIILFLFIAFLEDSGYMPRAAFLVDRIFGWCGLSGKSFIPMLSSFACAIPGIMATRTIEDRKLRFITILVSPLMSCSARLPVYTIMIAAFIPHESYFGFINSQGLVLTSLYLLGIVVAVIVSFILNKIIFKTDRGSFLMEMPSYKIPTIQSIMIRVYNRAKAFVLRAGTVILAITIIIWALSYYPRTDSSVLVQAEIERIETEHDASLNELRDKYASLETNSIDQAQLQQHSTLTEDDLNVLLNETNQISVQSYIIENELINRTKENSILGIDNKIAGENLRNSYFGKIGRTIEPIFEPLGWDWKITMSTLASFPAREVIIATLGTIFNLGSEVDEEDDSLISKMRQATWESGDKKGEPLFTPAVALSIMIFFALCCQCGATLVTIKQETNSWLAPIMTFLYMTSLAYLMSFIAYNLFSSWSI